MRQQQKSALAAADGVMLRACHHGEPGTALWIEWGFAPTGNPPRDIGVFRDRSSFCQGIGLVRAGRARRVVANAEYLNKSENPRFVVNSQTAEQWARANAAV